MGDVIVIAELITSISAALGVVWMMFGRVRKIAAAQRCNLRSDMLRTYYKHMEAKTIRQYEYENFIFCYEAYKALGGNSFIDKIYSEIKEWDVLS